MSPAPLALLNPNATPFVSNCFGSKSPERPRISNTERGIFFQTYKNRILLVWILISIFILKGGRGLPGGTDYNWRHYGLTTPPGFSSEPLSKKRIIITRFFLRECTRTLESSWNRVAATSKMENLKIRFEHFLFSQNSKILKKSNFQISFSMFTGLRSFFLFFHVFSSFC